MKKLTIFLLLMVMASDMMIAQEETSKEYKKETESPVYPDIDRRYKSDMSRSKLVRDKMGKALKKSGIVYGWGINTLLAGGSTEIPHKLWGSSNWEVGIVRRYGIGNTDHSILYGITLNTNYFKLLNTNIKGSSDEKGYELSSNEFYDKVRFGVRYINIPVGFTLRIFKKLYVFIGGHGGFKVKGYTKKNYTINNEYKIKEYTKGPFGLNKFNYGFDFSVGYNISTYFLRYDINPLFSKGDQFNILSIGTRTLY